MRGGVAVLQGLPDTGGFTVFRQHNDFLYLSGVEVPHAYLTIDGQNGQTVLYLMPFDEAVRFAGETVSVAARFLPGDPAPESPFFPPEPPLFRESGFAAMIPLLHLCRCFDFRFWSGERGQVCGLIPQVLILLLTIGVADPAPYGP